jgi:putative addiction module killer protein
MYLVGYTHAMTYEIKTTEIFDKWLSSIKDKTTKSRILARLARVENGNFGDHKEIERRLFELRFFFGSGYRIYYTKQGSTIILLLNGGDKSTQQKDITQAEKLLYQVGNESNENE